MLVAGSLLRRLRCTRLYKFLVCHTRDRIGACFAKESSYNQVKEWLLHQMDASPFHTLCVNTQKINDHLNENGNDCFTLTRLMAWLLCTCSHWIHPNAPAVDIAAPFSIQPWKLLLFGQSAEESIDYARDCVVGGLIGMITELTL